MEIQQAALRLGPADAGRLVSPEEFADATFDEPWIYEREAGRLIVMAPAGEGHLDATEPWRDRFIFYRAAHPGVIQRVTTEAWLRIDGGTDRIGDLGIYLVPRGPVPQIPDRVPDLMFEMVSPDKRSRDRDYLTKREEYFRFGIKEYVIVDRFAFCVTVLIHGPEGYEEQTLGRDDVYISLLLPGLAIPIRDVL